MNKFVSLVLSGFMLACSQQREAPQADSAAPATTAVMKMAESQPAASLPDAPPPSPPPPDQPESVASPTNSRKIIRNAQLRFRVSDFAAAGRRIDQAVRQLGGQVAGSNETKSDNSIENALTVRIPADRLDTFLNLVLKESIFTDTKTITAEDVTRQYVDVGARIRSKKAVEETYLKLLRQARSVADVLKVQEQLAQIQEEREVQEAELRQLRNEIALSTVNLTYYQQTERALNPEEPFYVRIGHNLADGFRLLGDVLVNVFYLVPLGLVAAGVVWLVMRWRRQRRKSAS